MSDDRMVEVRRDEQRKAAKLGEYSVQVQLAHPSARAKDPNYQGVVGDLAQILAVARPETVYLHNPADKHDTHVAVLFRSVEALLLLPAESRPQRVYGRVTKAAKVSITRIEVAPVGSFAFMLGKGPGSYEQQSRNPRGARTEGQRTFQEVGSSRI